MPKSIAEQVQAYLKKNPAAGNKDLYEAFPKVRPNTLRHYRSKFGDAPPKKAAVKKSDAPKAKRGRPKKTPDDMEMRVSNLEKKMDQLLKTLDVEVGKRGRRVNPIDKRFKEMEETILNFLKQRGSSMPTDLAKLEDLQKALSAKISGFISNLKKK